MTSWAGADDWKQLNPYAYGLSSSYDPNTQILTISFTLNAPAITDGTYNKDLIQQFCDDNGITCKFREEEDNNYNEGSIILQSRNAGDEVKKGTTLTITIATNTKDVNLMIDRTKRDIYAIIDMIIAKHILYRE